MKKLDFQDIVWRCVLIWKINKLSILSKTMKKLFIIVLTCILIAACKDHERSFVNKYEHEDFSEFTNSSVHHRGYDRNGGFILMVGITSGSDGPLVIKVDKEKKIKETSYKLVRDSSMIDQSKAHRLALKFLDYKIFSLMADSNNNVFVRIKETDKPQLASFSDPKYVKTADPFKSDWKHLKGNWYKARD